MYYSRLAAVAAVCLFTTLPARAQAPVDPSGHWEGAVQVPERGELKFEIDLAKNDKGVLAGTFSSAAQHVKGLPIAKVAVDGTSITFVVDRPDQPFTGVIAADGKSITGNIAAEGRSMPFTLTRTGEANILPLPTSPAIGKELEGTWKGTLTADGKEMRIVVKLSNQPDGRSVGTIANLDQGGADIPISSIRQNGADVTLDVEIVRGSYSGTLNAERTELSGKWTQGALVVPVILRK